MAWWKSLASDADAVYDDRVVLNAEEIEPTVTWGINPSQSVGVSEPIATTDGEALAYMGSTKPLTIAEYATIWLMLFQGTPAGPGGPGSPTVDPHTSTALPPVATSLHATVAITPLGKPEIPAYPYEHQNTDRASKWRIVVTGTLPAAASIASFKFGTIFTRNNKPFQPAVSVSDGRIKVTSLLPDKFTVEASQQLQNETVDLSFIVSGGD